MSLRYFYIQLPDNAPGDVIGAVSYLQEYAKTQRKSLVVAEFREEHEFVSRNDLKAYILRTHAYDDQHAQKESSAIIGIMVRAVRKPQLSGCTFPLLIVCRRCSELASECDCSYLESVGFARWNIGKQSLISSRRIIQQSGNIRQLGKSRKTILLGWIDSL